MQILAYAMHRVALLCKTRGINFKDCFRNYDKQTTCCVTEQQFRRCFPFEGFTEQEMDVLVNRYTDRYRSVLNGINYQAFHDAVMEHDPAPVDPPFPKSDLIIYPDSARWTAEDYTPEEKVQAKVVEKRVRIHECSTENSFSPPAAHNLIRSGQQIAWNIVRDGSLFRGVTKLNFVCTVF